MSSLHFQVILAGIFFGAWPLCMNKSGLSGNVASLAFSFLVFVSIIPFSVGQLKYVTNPNWMMIVAACIFGAAGLLLFNKVLATVSVQQVGTFFVLMVIAQVMVPAIYSGIVNGEVPPARIIGFFLAGISSFLLIKY